MAQFDRVTTWEGDMANESIREWLDAEVKPGYGAKFASAFEGVGIEDKSDLHDLNDEAMAELERELAAAPPATAPGPLLAITQRETHVS